MPPPPPRQGNDAPSDADRVASKTCQGGATWWMGGHSHVKARSHACWSMTFRKDCVNRLRRVVARTTCLVQGSSIPFQNGIQRLGIFLGRFVTKGCDSAIQPRDVPRESVGNKLIHKRVISTITGTPVNKSKLTRRFQGTRRNRVQAIVIPCDAPLKHGSF